MATLFFLEEGLKADETCLLITLRKERDKYVQFAKSFGIDLDRPRISGRLKVLTFPAAQLCVEKMLLEVCEELGSSRPSRVVFDSLGDLGLALRSPQRLQETVELLTACL